MFNIDNNERHGIYLFVVGLLGQLADWFVQNTVGYPSGHLLAGMLITSALSGVVAWGLSMGFNTPTQSGTASGAPNAPVKP